MEMDPVKKSYTNGEVTVYWEPDLCNHAAICFRSLPNVFKPAYRPWIQMDGATTAEIVKTVKQCPTKALHYKMNEELEKLDDEIENQTIITILEDGPYLVDGQFKVVDSEGNVVVCADGIALCRCGASKRKPFCDGAHHDINFKE